MKQTKISIIVPVYNVEKYLGKCIDSILNQTYKNFELILVDDGSTDSSKTICEVYSKKDNRIKLFHKTNGGLSDARNYGINHSNGEYLLFIDSDDFIHNHYLEILYNTIEKNNADLVICKYKSVYEKDNVTFDIPDKIDIQKYDRSQVYEKMFLQDGIDVSAVAKIYKKSIFIDNNIMFPKDMLYEDMQIIDKVIENCSSIFIADFDGYFYLQRSGSIMYSSMSEKRMSLIKKMDDLISLMKNKYPDAVDEAIKRYVYCNFHILGRSILNDEFINESKQIRNNILKNKKSIYSKSIYSKKEKVATFFLGFGLHSYKCFWKAFCLLKHKKFK